MATIVDPETHDGLIAPATGVMLALARLETLVRRALGVAAREPAPGEDPFRGLYLSAEEVARLLVQPPGAPRFLRADDDVVLSDAMPPGSRLAALATAFGLSEFDVDVLLIALGPELDLRYERIYAYLQDDVTRKRPSVNLALDLLCRSAEEKITRRAHFTADAVLWRNALLTWSPDSQVTNAPFLANALAPEGHVVRFLLGEPGLDGRIAPFCRLHVPSLSWAAAGVEENTRAVLGPLLERAVATGDFVTLCFHGRDECARARATEAVADAIGASLLAVELTADTFVDALLPVVFREAQLHAAVVVLEGWEAWRDGGHAASYRRLLSALDGQHGVVILDGAGPWTSEALGPRGVISVEFPLPDFASRRVGWAEGLAAVGARADTGVLDSLAERFRFSAEQICDSILTASRLARARDAGAHTDTLAATDLFTAARAQSRRQIAALAHHIEPRATWNDLVLGDDAVAALREICARASLGHRVLGEWGFDRRLAYGKGITALFSGPPGTGKTMAAEIIANELGLDLYRIDLAGVVSKYIGETEKNLDRLFRVAENAILLFDEADALFGKRSEVHEAHDRYANVEISYLLQKMEAYDGVAILATNLRHHLDEGFLRRLAFVVHFPFPDDVQRHQIWKAMWPAATPLGPDVDFDRLATTFRLSGGNIKNVALAAAFAAAYRGGPVTMCDLLHGVRREYQKMGKQAPMTDGAERPDGTGE